MPRKAKGKPLPPNKTEEPPIVKQWYNPTEAAKYLGISRFTIYHLMDDETLPFYELEGVQKRRLKKEDLDALLKKGQPSKKDDS